ncbi:hypothetical protein [Serratia liquefaciens]|jgi:hypothetical protein|uniref:hypothetical protein n=1 Tax=Enterobacterales TaxID=91347 RepID=UPI0021788EF8|nr:hypothetical protein [Serratia liquefaciens]CAI1188189.1 Uncharacterised protein [Serratia liquefaciens]CAI1203659.1 Uncharacterised protein [Serratia liquefaciens]CAI1745679.1 Uncharacterised protein [Serratia liquefaciens]
MSNNEKFVVIAVYNFLFKLTDKDEDKNTPVFFVIDSFTGEIPVLNYYINASDAFYKCDKLNRSSKEKWLIPDFRKIINAQVNQKIEVENNILINGEVKKSLNAILQKIIITRNLQYTQPQMNGPL